MPENRRRPWHRFYLHAAPARPYSPAEEHVAKVLAEGWNVDPPFYVTRRGAQRAAQRFEDMLPVCLYVRELD